MFLNWSSRVLDHLDALVALLHLDVDLLDLPSVASIVKPGSWIERAPCLMCRTEISADWIGMSMSAQLCRRDEAMSKRFDIFSTPTSTSGMSCKSLMARGRRRGRRGHRQAGLTPDCAGHVAADRSGRHAHRIAEHVPD